MQSIKNDEIRNYDRPQNELTTKVGFSYSGGTGYTSAPTVSFSGGAGSGAAATAVVENGRVVGLTITNQGTGYSGTPTIAFTGGGSTGAAATAIVDDGKVVGATITNSGADRKITVTDLTAYPSGDSREVVHVDVYDKAGNRASDKIPSGSTSVTIDVIQKGLTPSEGLKATATVVSALGKIKDGSAHDIGVIHNAGELVMEA